MGIARVAFISAAHLSPHKHTARIVRERVQVLALLLRVRHGGVYKKIILLGRVSYCPPSYKMPPAVRAGV